MSDMLRSTGAMAGATMISRVLGLVREMALARFMGNGWVASAFVFAFQIPNLFRRLLGEGALTAAFIPVFKETEQSEGEAGMWRTANAVVSGLVCAATVVVALAMLGVTAALGLGDFSGSTVLMLRLLRLMFPYTLLVCVAAVGMGILNARGRFFVPALGATVLNVVMIASVLWGTRLIDGPLQEKVYALAYGVLAAGVAQAAFLVPSLVRAGWRFRWRVPWREPAVAEVVRRMIPTTLGVAAFQINVLVTQGFAFVVGDSIVASFQYAVRLMELPQGLIGVSLATYLLPTLSGMAAGKRYDDFRATLVRGLSLLALLNLPASVLLLVLAGPIVRLLFEGGVFHAGATASVSAALAYLAPGLVAFSAVNILARAFYALGDTKVPMQISVFCLALNTVVSLFLVVSLQEAGLALANTLTSGVQVALLVHALRRKLPRLELGVVWREGRRLLVLVAGMGVVLWGVRSGWEGRMGTEGWGARMGAVFVPAAVGLALYFGVLPWLRVTAWDAFRTFGRREREGGGENSGRTREIS